VVGSWLDRGWIVVGSWLDRGWIVVGSWLDRGRIVVGSWLDRGWIVVGSWLDRGWIVVGSWSDRGWIVVGSCLVWNAFESCPPRDERSHLHIKPSLRKQEAPRVRALVLLRIPRHRANRTISYETLCTLVCRNASHLITHIVELVPIARLHQIHIRRVQGFFSDDCTPLPRVLAGHTLVSKEACRSISSNFCASYISQRGIRTRSSRIK
jgi:hypothetical protein